MAEDLHRDEWVRQIQEEAQSRVQNGESISKILEEMSQYSASAFKAAEIKDKPGIEDNTFCVTLKKEWWKETVDQKREELLDQLREANHLSGYLDSKIKQYPLTPQDGIIPMCGQRYERENQNED